MLNESERFIVARQKLSKVIKKKIKDSKDYDNMIDNISEFILVNFKKREKGNKRSFIGEAEYEILS
jgi:hypothetical protein